MEIEKIKITDIEPAKYNPRTISDDELTKLTNSINEFGLVDPIIINLKNNKIIGGHQRYEVLINQYMINNEFYAELNLIRMGDIGWVFIDSDLKIESEDHEKALNLALNKISGEWDAEKLTEILDELSLNDFNLDLTGFDGFEVDFYTENDDNDFSDLFDYDEDEEEEEPDDYVDVEGERTNEQYVISISFPTQEEANAFLEYLDAPYKLTQRSVGIHVSEINWEGKSEK